MITAKNCSLLQRLYTISTKRNCHKKDGGLRSRLLKHAKVCQEIVGSLTVAVFTGSLFLGGSYLFFVKLAEFGW